MAFDFERLDEDVKRCLDGSVHDAARVKGYVDPSIPGSCIYELHVDGKARRASISLCDIEHRGAGAAQEIAKRIRDAPATPAVG